MGTAGRSAAATLLTIVLIAALPVRSAAQEPSLRTVLRRAADYVTAFTDRLAGIVAEERYVQHVRDRAERRQLLSDLLLVRPRDADRYVEFRDVFEVDGRAVRNRNERLTRLFLDEAGGAQMKRVIEESARYNIGDIPRNINTPMLALVFLLPANQKRFEFDRTRGAPALAGDTIAGEDRAPLFRTETEMWVIEFRETRRPTLIRTNDGRNFPAAGRFWIDPGTGAVLMSELVMERVGLRAVIDVSYQSEPLLGFNAPVEMRERYLAGSHRVEGVASYGRFRQFQVRTDEAIVTPDAPKKPPFR